jgi:hypothetical protein
MPKIPDQQNILSLAPTNFSQKNTLLPPEAQNSTLNASQQISHTLFFVVPDTAVTQLRNIPLPLPPQIT